PPLSAEQRIVPLPEPLLKVGARAGASALFGLLAALKGRNNQGVSAGYLLRQLGIALAPAILFLAVAVLSYPSPRTAADDLDAASGLVQLGSGSNESEASTGLAEPGGGEETDEG